MKHRNLIIVGIGIAVILLMSWAIWFVSTSNLLRSTGLVSLSPGSRNLNDMEVTGPYGWYCMRFIKVPGLFPVNGSRPMEVSSKGWSECSLFGANVSHSTYYPAIKQIQEITLDQPTLIYQNPNKTLEIYIWITRDRTNIDRVEKLVSPQ